MDSDYSVFSILPPFNVLHAQIIDGSGHLVKDSTAASLTYEGVADPTGSINTSSAGKTNFWTYASAFFGASIPVDTGGRRRFSHAGSFQYSAGDELYSGEQHL